MTLAADLSRTNSREEGIRVKRRGASVGPHAASMRLVKLVPNAQVVEVFEFETADSALHGSMKMTTTLTDADGGTDVLIVHEDIPDAIPAADNETGTRMALANLARLVEAVIGYHSPLRRKRA